MRKISVAMCTYNGEKYLVPQIESILNQSNMPDEIIVCDDCSTDNTREILLRYQEKHPRLFQIHFNNTQKKTIKNFEQAIRLTTGDYIFLSDQDDVWEYNKVEKMLNYFKSDLDCLLLFSNGSFIDSNENKVDGTLFDKWGFDNKMKMLWSQNFEALKCLINNNNKITGATVCFKKELKQDALPIDTPYGFWHDTWLGMHAAKKNGLCFIDACLIKYRIHTLQQVGLSKEYKSDSDIQDEKMKEFVFDNYLKKNFKDVYKYYRYDQRCLRRRLILKIKKILNINEN